MTITICLWHEEKCASTTSWMEQTTSGAQETSEGGGSVGGEAV